MKVAVLFSGGKDSNFALYEASKYYDISCLITMKSVNQESYMFQTQGIDFTKVQASCLEIPQIEILTDGIKEKELDDLKIAIKKARDEFGAEGIVTGAIGSIYQASRVQKIAHDLGLWCFNPLWQKDQVDFLKELVNEKFEVMIVGVASYPLEEKYLGKILDLDLIGELVEMQKKWGLNPAGEGGELETFVLNSPLFKKKIKVVDSVKEWDNYSGQLVIKELEVVEK